MNISKKSWHYRILNFLDFIGSHESLCKYFWKVVVVLVIAPPLALIFLLVVTIPLHWSFDPNPGAIAVAILVGSIEIFILALALTSIIQDRYRDERWAGTRPYPTETPYVRKEPSLFRAWITAQHRKVCPLIDFVDKP